MSCIYIYALMKTAVFLYYLVFQNSKKTLSLEAGEPFITFYNVSSLQFKHDFSHHAKYFSIMRSACFLMWYITPVDL